MCKACSPGGRFLTFSFMFTPLPPFPSESTAVPTLCPFASFNSTVTGLLAAWIAAAPKNRATRVTVAFLIPFILTQKKGSRGQGEALRLVTILLSHAEIRDGRRIAWRVSGGDPGGIAGGGARVDRSDQSGIVAEATRIRTRRTDEDRDGPRAGRNRGRPLADDRVADRDSAGEQRLGKLERGAAGGGHRRRRGQEEAADSAEARTRGPGRSDQIQFPGRAIHSGARQRAGNNSSSGGGGFGEGLSGRVGDFSAEPRDRGGRSAAGAGGALAGNRGAQPPRRSPAQLCGRGSRAADESGGGSGVPDRRHGGRRVRGGGARRSAGARFARGVGSAAGREARAGYRGDPGREGGGGRGRRGGLGRVWLAGARHDSLSTGRTTVHARGKSGRRTRRWDDEWAGRGGARDAETHLDAAAAA